uniref:Protein shisa-5 n=1 Tax=Cyprinus carpio TaxID=7962 RepID=A0A8C2KEG0_CYPCA
MASTLAVLLLLSAGLFTVTVGFGDDCQGYFTRNNEYKPSIDCGFWEHCCGTCDNRFCCFYSDPMLSAFKQNLCNINVSIAIGLSVVGVVVFIILFITCCCCPCCCIYRMCRKPRPVVQTHVTTVMNTQSIQPQPVMQEVQYTQYQPVPTQPSYGGQPMQTGPYQEQSNAPGPPPSYDMATSPGYPTIQGAYDGDQAMYPMQPPAQPDKLS